MSKLLELAQKRLGWPSEEDIINPKGTGPRVIAELAKRKIQTAIRRSGINVNVGVLTTNPLSSRTEDPLAIVCDFTASINDDEILRETHRLAWSFSRSPMLITVEPSLLRVWTCWRQPEEQKENIGKLCVEKLERDLFDESSLSTQAAKALQWVELASGDFFKNPDYSTYFRRDQRADQLMLEDLKQLRQKLRAAELPEDICHDLIARVIFIEFLFQRKDKEGYAALNKQILANLHDKGVLEKQHEDLEGILRDYKDTYSFFRELNNRFNGDLFPGKGETPEEREREWRQEMERVRAEPHLNLLADFVSGKMEIASGQRCLWKRYAFDAIPLEFISSIYEEFVSKKKGKKDLGVHYTPGHIVDFMLDSVLPWDSKEWNVKILDPACGSGIFLVKSYQRLVQRWKNAYKSERKLTSQALKGLLENNLFGTDINGHAVRVASFSLYLAMCDELEPRHVWQHVKFPQLRDKSLIESDFFAEDKEGFRTDRDKETYDIIVGNAPWGRNVATDLAKSWAKRNPQDIWPIQYKSPGPLFLIKSAFLAKENGSVCMLQPAQGLLTNRQAKVLAFRKKLFSKFKVEEIVNLSALRFGLFKASISPVCIIKLLKMPPDEIPLRYICPKARRSQEDDYLVVVEPHDVNRVFLDEAANDPEVWSALMWGGRRDFVLIQSLKRKQNITNLSSSGRVWKRQGIIRGDRKKVREKILGKRILETNAVPSGSFLFIDAEKLPRNDDDHVHSRDSTDFRAFEIPQLIIRQSWRMEGRFNSFLVLPGKTEEGIVCSKSYISVHADKENRSILEAACLTYNSIFAVYYLFLTSGRCSGFIPEAYVEEILSLPIPKTGKSLWGKARSFRDVDEYVRNVFGFNDAEWALVEDLFNFVIPDFKGGAKSPGRQSTRLPQRRKENNERVLKEYVDYFRRVIVAGFGQDKLISATIFEERSEEYLPVRLIALHLDPTAKPFIRLEKIDSQKLTNYLRELDNKYLSATKEKTRGGIFHQRVARVYDIVEMDGKRIPTVFIIKPDQVRYWTRSMAMRDADEIAGDIMLWQETSESKGK